MVQRLHIVVAQCNPKIFRYFHLLESAKMTPKPQDIVAFRGHVYILYLISYTKHKCQARQAGAWQDSQSPLFPVVSAKRSHAPLREVAQGLEQSGKTTLQIICAAMRKLLHLAWV